jgi:hypothetical protein
MPRSHDVDDLFGTHRVSDSLTDDVKGSPSLPGAGAKQEPRLFRDLPELLSPVADGPVVCRGFSISAGQRIVWITLGVK